MKKIGMLFGLIVLMIATSAVTSIFLMNSKYVALGSFSPEMFLRDRTDAFPTSLDELRIHPTWFDGFVVEVTGYLDGDGRTLYETEEDYIIKGVVAAHEIRDLEFISAALGTEGCRGMFVKVIARFETVAIDRGFRWRALTNVERVDAYYDMEVFDLDGNGISRLGDPQPCYAREGAKYGK